MEAAHPLLGRPSHRPLSDSLWHWQAFPSSAVHTLWCKGGQTCLGILIVKPRSKSVDSACCMVATSPPSTPQCQQPCFCFLCSSCKACLCGVLAVWLAVQRSRPALSMLLRELCCWVMQGSGLPSLLQSKLTAPRILPVHKVAVYCQSKLAEQSYHMQLGVVWWYPDKHQVWPSNTTTGCMRH